ncbi:MAG: 4-hydroxythreonine-4-phosphate dehydrogenase PdxA [Burkholderia sp.]|nr:MAG: 4-hydroxythreonine-4-phosphate dehydrogenase [Burkholderia gladioli]
MQAAQPLRIAITTGEPAGIGPQLSAQALAQAAQRWPDAHFEVLCDAALFTERASAVGVDTERLGTDGRVRLAHSPLVVPSQAGRLNAANALYVLGLLDAAIAGALAEDYDAIVTAPIQKSIINDAGVPFTGHTEYLAERTATPHVVMMLAGTGKRPLRVALATTHLPLKEVSAALSIDGLVQTLEIINGDLCRYFGLAAPRILVTGLNPHTGEKGYLGREEINLISPALERAQQVGIDACGPYPADTLFQPRYLEQADCVLTMFHDQGLPVLKYATLGAGINVTLGLPIVRTSVDHGTALDLAGSGRADCASMIAALDTAVEMARHRLQARAALLHKSREIR